MNINCNYSVYALTSPEGKKYIGMTMRELKQRWRGGWGYLFNERLYKDIQKYGWDSFEKGAIKTGMTKEEAENFEREMIAKFETQNPEKGYNIEEGGRPRHIAESTRLKMSIASIGQIRDETYRRHISESKKGARNGMFGKSGALSIMSKKVVAENGEQVLYFDGMSEAARVLGLSKNAFKNISACVHGKRRTAYGYKWRYRDD